MDENCVVARKSSFEAYYVSGMVIQWEAPQTWRHVFSCFKHFGSIEGYGELYCSGVLIRTTGVETQPDPDDVAWEQFLQYEADCCMSDWEAQLREQESAFDPWGSFDWSDYHG